MITEEDEYFLRASMLLLKGGRLMSKETLYKELRKTGENLDALLRQHQDRFKHRFVRKQKKKLFPAAGVTDVETWDLSMLTTVSLTVFKQSLNDDEKNGLKSIRCMRDEICAHTYSSSLSADQYEEIRKELQNVLTSLSNGLSEKLKDDCLKIIQECTNGPISPSLQTELTKQIEDKEHSFQEVMNKLRNQKEFLCELKKEVIDSIHRIMVIEDRSAKIIKVIDNELTLSGAVNESKEIDFVERIITTVINKAIKKVGNKYDYPRIRSVVDKILKDIENMPDVEILPAEDKSILHPTYIDSDVAKGESYGSTKKTHQYPNNGTFAACGGNPGDPSDSDGSDSEDESKNHAKDVRDENDPKRDGNNECNISDWRIDTDVWKRCIEMKDVEEATRLVNDGILPDQNLLDRASEVFDVPSKIVQNIYTAICCYLKNKMRHINRVWPALDYRHEFPNKQITFVIYTSQSFDTETIEYRYYERTVNKISKSCSNENIHIKELEQNCEKDYSETEKIRKCLNKYSKSLMERHKNLTRISISWFKSGGYGTEKRSIKPKTCIALYVQVKGFVPLNETVLPKELDGIVVDVREGVVTSYIGPNEHHEHVKMGCAVHSGLKDNQGTPIGGTLGGFVEINTAVYCISCAHVFLSPEDMEKLKTMGICNLTNDTIIRKFNVRQPVHNGSRAFGIGVRAVYKEGGNGETGVEVVIIEVKDRFPISGEFPDCPHNRNPGCDSLKFSSGKMCNREEVKKLIREKKLTVVKFGCISGWTRGVIRIEGGSARLRHMVGTIEDTDEFGLLLYNQYEIESIGRIPFASSGDSGALVFTDAYGPLSAIGIVEGGMAEVVTYVTPICEVFAALNLQDQVQNMKIFPSDCPDIQNIPMLTDDSNTSQYLTNRSDSGVSSADGTTLCNVEEKLTTLEQDLPQEIAKHAHAIKDDVNTITQELVPVKSELNLLKSDVSVLNADITIVKTEVENTKRDLKHEIDKSKNELQSKMNAMQEQMKEQTELFKRYFAQFSPPSPATSTSNTHPS